jgi:16S rRNA processing protein RimM
MLQPVAPTEERRVVVGRIAGIFGVKGWVRVFSYTDPPENILMYSPWLIGDGDSTGCRVTDGAVHGRGIIAHIDGIDDRDVARGLIGKSISVPRALFRDTHTGEYYWSDLLGLHVVNQDGVPFGTVADVVATGANDVLVINGDRRRLLPFVTGQVIKAVDLESGVIHVEWDADF